MLREFLLLPRAQPQVFMGSGADGVEEPTETVCPLLAQLHKAKSLLRLRRESSSDSEKELAYKVVEIRMPSRDR